MTDLVLRWRRVDAPGFTARTASVGYPGPASAGSVDGRGAVAFVAGSAASVIEFAPQPLDSLAYSDAYLATSGGTLWSGEWDARSPGEWAPVTPLVDGAPADRSWATCADTDVRAVLAHGERLSLWSAAYGDEPVPVPGQLRLVGDPGDVVVTSHQGVVAVAGPVGDDSQRTSVFVCADPDFGDEAWERLPLDPAPSVVSDGWGWSVGWWLAGTVGDRVTVWDDTGRALDLPPLPAADRVLLLRGPVEPDDLLLATRSAGRWQLHARAGEGWRTAPGPAGELAGARLCLTDDDDGEVVLAVVDGGLVLGEMG